MIGERGRHCKLGGDRIVVAGEGHLANTNTRVQAFNVKLTYELFIMYTKHPVLIEYIGLLPMTPTENGCFR